MEHCVSLKGSKDGIVVVMEEVAGFEAIQEELLRKLQNAAGFFQGANKSIQLKGKKLTEEQEISLVKLLSDTTGMEISFYRTSEDEEEKGKKLLEHLGLQQHNVTKFYQGAIRSGQSIEFSGSVVVIGDVNPGAVIKAEGNIIILGALKGIAHAGCSGMTDAFVVALTMDPVQLRIANIITRFPETEILGKSRAKYAYIEDGQVYVIPLD